MARWLHFATRVLAPAAGVMVGGCVTERELQEAAQLRRPAMPSAKAMPAAVPPVPSEDESLAAILRSARAGELAAAAARIEQAPTTLARERLAQLSAAALVGAEPERAEALALRLAPGFAQTAALRVVAEDRVRREPDAAIRWALEFPDSTVKSGVCRLVAESLVAADAAGGMQRLLAVVAEPARDEMLGFAAAAWARRDAAAAGSWLQLQTDEALRRRLAASVGFEIAQTNPMGAIPFAELLPPGRDRWLLYTAITQTWIAVDAKAAFAWTNQLPDGDARAAAIAGIDAGLGIAVARRMVPGPDTNAGTVRRAGGAGLTRLGAEEDAAFASWLATQGGEFSRDAAIVEYVRQRGATDPYTVGQWIVSLPGGPTRDEAMEVFWRSMISVSSTEAARWLRTLPRSDRGNAITDRMIREWLRTDPAAAEAWLLESNLPSDLIEGHLRATGRR